MRYLDFEYDGICLSDKGLVICNFDSNKIQTNSNGSVITFNTVSTMNGQKHEKVSSKYDECLTTTFQVCKNLCGSDREDITVTEVREISRWLNRQEYLKLKFLNDKNLDMYNIFFEATFNVSKIEIDDKIVGLELEVLTNRPFALHEQVTHNLEFTLFNETKEISFITDEIGFMYPEMEVTINETEENNNTFNIYTNLENRITTIKNCTEGETIKFNYPIIKTDNENHKIQNDFNWIFFRLSNTFKERRNKITTSLPCSIKLKYYPIVKIGL